MDELLSSTILKLRETTEHITRTHIAPRSAEVDANCQWPAHSLQALAEAGLLGLHVPKRLGGLEQGLLALATISETIAQGCASSALCYAMHCVGSAVITAKATPFLDSEYLVPIAEGRHITTLALSEPGTGSHFYFPQTTSVKNGDNYIINGNKLFVTNGSHADSYVLSTQVLSTQVLSTQTSDDHGEPGEFNCYVINTGTDGMAWQEPWQGFGMRGNSSRGLQLENVTLPADNLLGREGDQVWYVFEVVAPYFLMAMSGTYLGLAQAALDYTLTHIKTRSYKHSGERLASVSIIQHKLAEMSIAVEKTRRLVYHAAYLGDTGDAKAVVAIMQAKADAAETAVYITNEAMTCCGGTAYRENSRLSQMLRDARAGQVMAPTTDILKTWTGRLLLGEPLF